MNTSFDKIMDFIIKAEGGLVDNPNDPGRETKYGISKRQYPSLDIKNLTEEQAREIYRTDYWNKIKGDELPYPLDMCVMDMAVNAGVSASSGVLKLSKDYKSFLLLRVNHYISITQKNPKLKEFFFGWIIRVNNLRKLCEG